jgi:hypothetical protein
MTAERTRKNDLTLQITDHRTPGHDGKPAILILGSCRGDAFVASEVLICADALGAAEAMSAWLATHEIHVTSSDGGRFGPSSYASDGQRSGPEGVPSSVVIRVRCSRIEDGAF